MDSNNVQTLRLLLCVTGLLNDSSNVPGVQYHNVSYGVHPGQPRFALLQPVFNGTGAGSWNATGDRETWLSDFIKTKLVPTVCVFGIVGNISGSRYVTSHATVRFYRRFSIGDPLVLTLDLQTISRY